MATYDTPRRRRWFDALFGEAFELERRRRRRRRTFLAVVACAAAVAFAVGLHDGGSGSGSTPGADTHIRSLALGGGYTQLAAVEGKLVVSGGSPGVAPAGRIGGLCHSATIDPLTMRVIAKARGNCANPAIYGRNVLPITYVLNHSGPTGLTLAIRIASIAPHAPGGYRLGPVVVYYPQCSDCAAEWIYGDGSLWLYSPFYGPGLGSSLGRLLKISARTGRVLGRWLMPSFPRALLAVDRDGLWLAPSIYGGVPAHLAPGLIAQYSSLYRVAPERGGPERVRATGVRGGALWMVASGSSLWVDESNGRTPSRLWRLVGMDGRVGLRARRVAAGAACGQLGEGQVTIAGSAKSGIYCVDQTAGRLQSFDPATGSARSYPAPGSMAGPAVSLGASVYFLGGDAKRQHVFRVVSLRP